MKEFLEIVFDTHILCFSCLCLYATLIVSPGQLREMWGRRRNSFNSVSSSGLTALDLCCRLYNSASVPALTPATTNPANFLFTPRILASNVTSPCLSSNICDISWIYNMIKTNSKLRDKSYKIPLLLPCLYTQDSTRKYNRGKSLTFPLLTSKQGKTSDKKRRSIPCSYTEYASSSSLVFFLLYAHIKG